MGKNRKKWYLLIVLALCMGLFLCALVLPSARDTSAVRARGGVLDLSKWDGKTMLALSGGWSFYWNKLLTEQDLRSNPAPDLIAQVPSVWNGYVIHGKQAGGSGYATYRLHVTGVKAGETFSMRVPPLLTAYALYVNGQLLASSGKSASSQDGYAPQYRIQTFSFTPKSDTFDIIVHVSNFVYARGGMCYTFYFAVPAQMESMNQTIFARDIFVCGSLLLISFYALFLFCLRRDKGELLLCIIGLLLLGRTLIDGNYLINALFPTIWFRGVIWIDYMTLYWLPGLCIWLAQCIFAATFPPKITRACLLYAAGMTAVTLVLPFSVFTQLIYPAEAVALLAGIYVIFKLIAIMASSRMSLETSLLFAGAISITCCVMHDVLYENNVLRMGYLEFSPAGFLVMCVLLGCVLGLRYDRQRRAYEQTLLELNASNERERKMELRFLKSQIRPHFINNALNAIISVSRTDTKQARKLMVAFSRYLRNCYDVADLDDKISIQQELSFVESYVSLQQARFPDTLRVRFDIDKVSVRIPPLTLQPLVENAIVHGCREIKGAWEILVYAKADGCQVKIGVKDNGKGIDPIRAVSLLTNGRPTKCVGIYNINQRLRKIYRTQLHIEHPPEGGAEIYFLIPRTAPDSALE